MAPYRFCKWVLKGMPITLCGDENQLRNFIFIDNIAKGTIMAEKNRWKKPITFNQFINFIEEINDKRATIKHLLPHTADMMSNMAKIRKAKALQNWELTIGVGEVLEIML